MNWIILIVAGFFESGFAFCLGKMKEVSGTEWYRIPCLSWTEYALARQSSADIAYRHSLSRVDGHWLVMGIVFFHEPTSFLRLFFISTLIISIVGLKVVSA